MQRCMMWRAFDTHINGAHCKGAYEFIHCALAALSENSKNYAIICTEMHLKCLRLRVRIANLLRP